MTENVYWIKQAEPHRIGIVPRPRGGDWLEDDIKNLSSEGVEVLASMLTPEESDELGLTEEERLCNHFGIRFFNLPIADRSVPDEDAILRALEMLVKHVKLGCSVGFHCRAGIGRSAMLAALVLARLGWTPDAAFRAISESRGCRVPIPSNRNHGFESLLANFSPPSHIRYTVHQ
jgi:protein-tyrosine phosphatase